MNTPFSTEATILNTFFSTTVGKERAQWQWLSNSCPCSKSNLPPNVFEKKIDAERKMTTADCSFHIVGILYTCTHKVNFVGTDTLCCLAVNLWTAYCCSQSIVLIGAAQERLLLIVSAENFHWRWWLIAETRQRTSGQCQSWRPQVWRGRRRRGWRRESG